MKSSVMRTAVRSRWGRWSKYAILLLVLVSLPVWLGEYQMHVANLMLVNATIVIGLVMLLGWSGQFSFSSATFVGIGAYSGGRLASVVDGLPLEATLLIGTVSGALVGLAFGMLAVRVRRYYMAIATIAFMYLCQLIERQGGTVTGGPDGFLVPSPSVALLGGAVLESAREQYAVGLVLLVIVFVFATWLKSTRLARGWIALKVDDRFAQAIGVNIYWSRLAAFVIASAIFALGGTWTAVVTQFASPDSFSFDMLLSHFIFMVVGGVLSLFWAVFAALGLTFVAEYVRGFSGASEMIYGGILLFSVLVMRNGIYGIYRYLTKEREPWL